MKPKQSRVVDAAATLFVAHGYDKTSIEMIAEAAVVSRQTIYNQFGSKESLFLSIADDLTTDLSAGIAKPLDAGVDLQATLERFANRFLRLILADRTVAIYRLFVAEVPRFPGLSEAIYKNGIVKLEEQLARYLDAQSGLSIQDRRFAAQAFLSLAVHPLHLRAQLGQKLTRREIGRHAKAAVRLFLRCYGKADRPKARPGR